MEDLMILFLRSAALMALDSMFLDPHYTADHEVVVKIYNFLEACEDRAEQAHLANVRIAQDYLAKLFAAA